MTAGKFLPLAMVLCGLMVIPVFAVAQSNDGANASRRGDSPGRAGRSGRRDRRPHSVDTVKKLSPMPCAAAMWTAARPEV